MAEGETFLREAQGDDYTYGLSKPLVRGTYDSFVSHTWRSNSIAKWLALNYQYNGKFALKATHVSAFIIFLMQLFWRFALGGTLPVLGVHMVPGMAGWHPGGPEAAASAFANSPTGFLPCTGICLVGSGAVGCICLFYGHMIQRWLFGTNPRVFFDKCCIHQTDNEKRRAGIHALGDAIQRSQSVLVLADPTYFNRL